MPESLRACLACGSDAVRAFFTADRPVPVFCNVLHRSRDEALRAPTGTLVLAACQECGHVFNAAFDAGLVDYSPSYENSLHFSGVFQEYAQALAARLVSDHDLRGATVVEIGSGKGDFLALLCAQGVAKGIGYDPSYAGEVEHAPDAGNVLVYRTLFPEDPGSLSADLVCSRHVLEHVERPAALLATLRAALGGDSRVPVYLEVPDGEYLLRTTALWDAIYEHPSHFTGASLRRVLDSAGFEGTRTGGGYGGQFLWAESWRGLQAGEGTAGTSGLRAAATRPAGVDAVLAAAGGFQQRAARLVEHWNHRLSELEAAGERVAVWGAGSKGVTFLNLVTASRTVAAVVDINPRKRHHHVPGTGHRVVAPEDLAPSPPHHVLVLNSLYRDEVRNRLTELGIDASVEVVATGVEVVTTGGPGSSTAPAS